MILTGSGLQFDLAERLGQFCMEAVSARVARSIVSWASSLLLLLIMLI